MSRHLIIVAYGRPAPQGSKTGGNVGQMREASRFLPAWRERVTAAAVSARAQRAERGDPWNTVRGAVILEMHFTQRVAPTSRPDWDKLARAVCDSLTEAGIYKDDSQIVQGYVRKLRLGEPGALTQPGVWIGLTKLSES